VKKVQAALAFNSSGYIGLPYWAERNQQINILKEVNPRLGEAKKAAALLAACEKHGKTKEEYDKLCELAARPFYTADGTRQGEIVIPERVIQSFLNHTSMAASFFIWTLRGLKARPTPHGIATALFNRR